MKTSPMTAVVLLQTTLTILALAPGAVRADALDHWTPSQVSTNPMGYMGIMLRGLAYANGRYVAVGTYTGSDTGMIQTSEDGLTWTKRSPLDDSVLELYDVAYGNGVFVAVGWGALMHGQNLYHSADGINWTSHTNATVSNFYSVVCGLQGFVAVGDGIPPDTGGPTNRNIYTSPDGITWTGRSSGAPVGDVHSIMDVATAPGLSYVAVDDVGNVYRSALGTTWTRQVPALIPPATLSGNINWCGVYISLSTTGTNYVSGDGLSWSAMVKDVTNAFSRVVASRGIYAALSGTKLFTSTNLTNWVERNFQPPPNAIWGGLAFGSTNLAVVGTTYPPFPSVPIALVSDSFIGLGIESGFPPRLAISGLQGGPYRIEGLDTLPRGTNNWQALANLSLTNSPLVWTDTTATNSRHFYRVVLVQP